MVSNTSISKRLFSPEPGDQIPDIRLFPESYINKRILVSVLGDFCGPTDRTVRVNEMAFPMENDPIAGGVVDIWYAQISENRRCGSPKWSQIGSWHLDGYATPAQQRFRGRAATHAEVSNMR